MGVFSLGLDFLIRDEVFPLGLNFLIRDEVFTLGLNFLIRDGVFLLGLDFLIRDGDFPTGGHFEATCWGSFGGFAATGRRYLIVFYEHFATEAGN